MIDNVYLLNKKNLKIKFMLKYSSSHLLKMYYSETKVIMGGLAHIPILIFIVNFIKGKFESIASKVVEYKTEEPKVKVVEVKEEEVKSEELNASEVKEEAE